ncbi:MAG: hypothetical protein HY302_09980 [Opitutae bacterium]|nr:hypothetical protein [Opitutae bacterium]
MKTRAIASTILSAICVATLSLFLGGCATQKDWRTGQDVWFFGFAKGIPLGSKGGE